MTYLILIVLGLLFVARILYNARFLKPGAITPQQVQDDRIKAWSARLMARRNRWFNRGKTDVNTNPPATPTTPDPPKPVA